MNEPQINAWVPGTEHPVPAAESPDSPGVSPATGPTTPQGAGVDPPTGGLPAAWAYPGSGAAWWWVGCHGGAGTTTLSRAFPGGADGGTAWPWAEGLVLPVVLVARTHMTGLLAAQQAARQWASRAVTGVNLLGLVLVADAPGRLPPELRDTARLVAGGVPRTWRVPWIDTWRLGDPGHPPRPLTRLVRDLSRLCESGAPHA